MLAGVVLPRRTYGRRGSGRGPLPGRQLVHEPDYFDSLHDGQLLPGGISDIGAVPQRILLFAATVPKLVRAGSSLPARQHQAA